MQAKKVKKWEIMPSILVTTWVWLLIVKLLARRRRLSHREAEDEEEDEGDDEEDEEADDEEDDEGDEEEEPDVDWDDWEGECEGMMKMKTS